MTNRITKVLESLSKYPDPQTEVKIPAQTEDEFEIKKSDPHSDPPAHGGVRHYLQNKQEASSGRSIIDHSSNLNPFGPPASALAVLADKDKLIAAIRDYPDPSYAELVNALCKFYGRDEASCIPVNGISDGISHLLRTLRDKRSVTRVIVFEPTFSEYRLIAEAFDLDVIAIVTDESHGYQPHVDQLKNMPFKNAAVFICDPNNPTGSKMPTDFVNASIAKAVRDDGYLVLDRSFSDLVLGGGDLGENEIPFMANSADVGEEDISLRSASHLIELRSMTKLFGIAGLRIGAMFAQPNIALEIKDLLPPWSIGGLNELLALNCIADGDFLTESLIALRENKAEMLRGLSGIKDLKVFRSDANFFLIKILREDITAAGLQEELFSKGILIRNCSNYIGLNEKYFRIAVLKKPDNTCLVDELRLVFQSE